MITPIFEEDFHDNGYGFRSDRCAQQAIIKALDMMNNHNDWNQAIRGWVNYYRIGQMKSICRKTDQHMRFRLRMCIWKQWKKGGNRYRWLVQLGINKYMAWEWSNSRKSYARVARSFIMYRAVNNAVLKKRDLVFLLDHYQKVHI